MPFKITIIIGFCLLIACILAGCGHKINPWLSPATIPLKDACIYLTGRLDFNNDIAHSIHTRRGIRYILKKNFTSPKELNALIQETITGGKCLSKLSMHWPAMHTTEINLEHIVRPLKFRFKIFNKLNRFTMIPRVSSNFAFNVRPERYYPWPFWPWGGPAKCCVNFYSASIKLVNPLFILSHFTSLGVRACARKRCATLWWPSRKKAPHQEYMQNAPFSSPETSQ